MRATLTDAFTQAIVEAAGIPGRDPVRSRPPDLIVREDDRVTIRDEAAALSDEIAELRHDIHREPEIGLQLPRTQRKVLAALEGLPLEITTGRELTSVTAVLRGARPGPVVLLRADMDALPVTEATGCRTPPGSTPRCTPAGTTCTRRCWLARRACSAPGEPNSPGA